MKKTKKKPTGAAARITDAEVEAAKRLAARKSGVTRKQLSETLKCGLDRAATILERTGARKLRLGAEKGGKAYRTLIYTLA